MSSFKFSKPIVFAWVIIPLITLACASPQSNEEANTPLPSAACQAAWADSTAMEFVAQLETSTSTNHPVWPGYELGDGAVILHAGFTPDSTACLGLWQHGKAIDYTTSEAIPKLSTLLYGYYMNFEGMESSDNPLVSLSQQPAPISQWIESHGLKSAVLMPVDFPNFPFDIPALMKMQIAIHESFHVEVMLHYWFTGMGNWPAWDEQPDRPGVQQCYQHNETVQSAFREEKSALTAMIEALLDDDSGLACEKGNEFLKLRSQRYSLLGEVTVKRQDESLGDCAEAENIMELEEGLADYASWTMLYETDIAIREQLIRRYNAQQNDSFYLTGAMLMHAISIMHEGAIFEVINDINQSETVEQGALVAMFEKKLKAYCRN